MKISTFVDAQGYAPPPHPRDTSPSPLSESEIVPFHCSTLNYVDGWGINIFLLFCHAMHMPSTLFKYIARKKDSYQASFQETSIVTMNS